VTERESVRFVLHTEVVLNICVTLQSHANFMLLWWQINEQVWSIRGKTLTGRNRMIRRDSATLSSTTPKSDQIQGLRDEALPDVLTG